MIRKYNYEKKPWYIIVYTTLMLAVIGITVFCLGKIKVDSTTIIILTVCLVILELGWLIYKFRTKFSINVRLVYMYIYQGLWSIFLAWGVLAVLGAVKNVDYLKLSITMTGFIIIVLALPIVGFLNIGTQEFDWEINFMNFIKKHNLKIPFLLRINISFILGALSLVIVMILSVYDLDSTFASWILLPLIFISMFFVFISKYFLEDTAGLITAQNDVENIYDNPIVFYKNELKICKNDKVFELNIRRLVPQGSRTQKFESKSGTTFISSEINNDIERINIIVPFKSPYFYIYDEFKITYTTNENNEVKIRVLVSMHFEVVNNELLCTEVVKINEGRIRLNLRERNYENLDITTISPLNALYNNRYYAINDNNEVNIDREISISEQRRFMLREGAYGRGKTTADVTTLSNWNTKPVTVSLWNDNYNGPLIYVIFDSLRVAAKNKNITYTRMTKFLFYPIIAGTIGIVFSFIKNKDVLRDLWSIFGCIRFKIYSVTVYTTEGGMNNLINLIFRIIASREFILIVAGIIGYKIAKKHAAEFILYKNYSLGNYQEFFKENIRKMMGSYSGQKLTLILEDIDRMEYDEIRDAFRLISNLNKTFEKENEVIGIVSFDRSTLIRKISKAYQQNDTSDTNNIENREEIELSPAEIEVNDLISKTLISGILPELDENLLINYTKYLIRVYLRSIVVLSLNNVNVEVTEADFITMISAADFSHIGFREVRGVIEIMIDYYNQMKSLETEDTININRFMTIYAESIDAIWEYLYF